MADEHPIDFIPNFDDDDGEMPVAQQGDGEKPVTSDVVVRVYFPRQEPASGPPPAAPRDEAAAPPAAAPEPAWQPSPSAELLPDLEEPEPDALAASTWPTERGLPTPPDLAEFDEPEPYQEPTLERDLTSVPAPAELEEPRSSRRFALWLSLLIIILLLASATAILLISTDALPRGLGEFMPFVPSRDTPVPQGEQDDLPAAELDEITLEPTQRGDEAAATLAAANAAAPLSTATDAPTEPASTSGTPVPTSTPEDVQGEEGILQRGVPMVMVPGGTFMMGGGPSEPAHEVTLDAFYIDRHEVTNAQWEECVLAGACLPPSSSTDYLGEEYYGTEAYADYPVVSVNWQNADAYCDWRGARLPTEAEWEMAARWSPFGGESIYPWGDEWEPTRLNYCDESCVLQNADAEADDGWPQAAPVDAFPSGASAVGALNMAGNVAEWTADWFGEDYYEDSPEENPTGPATGTERVVRGGAWGVANVDMFDMRARSKFAPELQGPGIGLRCAISASEMNP